DDLPRPPLDLVLALDTSSTLSLDSLASVQRGLHSMVASLDPEDRVSLVTYDTTARLVVLRAEPSSEALREAIDGLVTGGKTNLYDGLRLAYETALSEHRPGEHDRVVLVS